MIEQESSPDDEFENETDDYYENSEETYEQVYDLSDNKVEKIESNCVSGQTIEWEQSLSVDIPEINELQQNMFKLLNGLINSNDHDDEAVIKDGASMVTELTEYSRYYFSKEEEYLKKYGYPDIDCHSKEHRQFIKNTINLRRQVAEDKNNLSYNTVSNLRDWLVNHISQSDRSYIPFVRINNYVEECRLKRLA